MSARRRVLAALACWTLAALRHVFVWGGALAPVLHALEWGLTLGGAFLLLRAALEPRPAGRRLYLWPLLAAACLPPFLSEDVFAYVVRGRVLALHAANPYTNPPARFADRDPTVRTLKAWAEFPLPYGPLLAYVQGGAALASAWAPPAAALWLGSYVLKLLFTLCWAAACLVVRARAGPEAGLLLALHPLLLLEGPVNGHNDPLLALLLVLAVTALADRRAFTAGCALGLAVLVKFVPLLLLPLFVRAARGARLRFAAGLGLGLAGLALAWLWFWREPGALDFLRAQASLTGGSLPSALALLFGGGAKPYATLACLGAAGLFALREALRPPAAGALGPRAARSLAFLAAFGLPFTNPWYAFWWAPLALLGSTPQAARRALVVLALLGPASYSAWLLARDLSAAHMALQWGLGIVPAVLVLLAGAEGRPTALRPPPA